MKEIASKRGEGNRCAVLSDWEKIGGKESVRYTPKEEVALNLF